MTDSEYEPGSASGGDSTTPPVDGLDPSGTGVSPTEERSDWPSAADERIADLLASGLTQARVGDEVGLSARTIRRRLEDPNFRAYVERRCRDASAELFAEIGKLRKRAASALEECLDSGNERIKLQAARAVIDMSGALRREFRNEELVDRLKAVQDDIARRDSTSGTGRSAGGNIGLSDLLAAFTNGVGK